MPNTTNDLQVINRSFEERDAKAHAQKLNLPYIEIGSYPLNPEIVKLVPAEKALSAHAIVFDRSGKNLKVAFVDPEDAQAKDLRAFLVDQGFASEVFVCSKTGFHSAYEVYGGTFFHKKRLELRKTFNEEEKSFTIILKDGKELREKVLSLPVAEALHEIQIAAIKVHASDIHIQPEGEGVVLRFRIDGVLHEVFTLPLKCAQALVLHIKYDAGMRSNISDIPQDGHMSMDANERQVDFRVSTLPTPKIESVVMRVLDSSRGILPFEQLGFLPAHREAVENALRTPDGMILVTGPTGSGKTTTLYSLLSELNTPARKLVTLEDPIEYHLGGVTQSQVNEDRAYNFETGLKALLRHDPDVILVGEIRTFQTAKLAAEASLTGHIVLSSLHANSSIGTIARLRNLGLQDYNIAPSITLVVAQRLVRKVCPHCAKEVPFTPQDPFIKDAITRLQDIGTIEEIPTHILHAEGCEQCSGTGYDGLTAVGEVLPFTEEVMDMILHQKTESEILDHMYRETDFLSLFESGLLRVLRQETTLEELYRAV